MELQRKAYPILVQAISVRSLHAQTKPNHSSGKSPKTKQMAKRCTEIQKPNGKTAPEVTSKYHQAWDASPKRCLTNWAHPFHRGETPKLELHQFPKWKTWGFERGTYQNASRCQDDVPDTVFLILQYLVFLRVEVQTGADKRRKRCPGERDFWQLQRITSLPFSVTAQSSEVE